MEASSKEQDACQSVSDAGQGPSGALSPTHDEVGLSYADVTVADSETVPRRDRYSRRLHNAIEIAARSCTDCRLSSSVRAAMRSGGPRSSEWTAAQVSMLELCGNISGRHDTCRLARFVAGKTCRQVADYIEARGWTERAATGDEPPLQNPLPDAAELRLSSRIERVNAAVVVEDPSRHHQWAGRLLSQGSSSASGQRGTMSSQEDPDAPWKEHDFVPCFHLGSCTEERCRCARHGLACEKTCGCECVRCMVAAHPTSSAAHSSLSREAVLAPGSTFCSRRVW